MAKKKTSKAPRTRSSTSGSGSRSTPRKAASAEPEQPRPALRLEQKVQGSSANPTRSFASGNGSGSSATSRPAQEERPPLTEAQLKKVKTGLTKKDLEHYRKVLLEKRAQIVGAVESMEGDARNISGGNLSSMPMHMADIGSDNYEQEFTLGLVESERKLLREIDDALMRIHKGIYGVCLESGKPIGKARLDAKPWAKYCIEVAREKERLGEM